MEIMPNVIDVKGLTFSYDGGKPVLNNLNMSFKKATITGVLGGNGAGKSTLFLNMNGVLRPDIGEILINGVQVDYSKSGLIDLRKRVGLIFQDPNDQLFAPTVAKDITFGLLNMGYTQNEASLKVEDILEKTGLTELKDTPIHFLSFGQKKRVAIAGVLVMQPDVIILDEPTAGLDPKGVSHMLHLLEDIRKNKDVTVIISTHDIDLIPLYCDYAYVLDRGVVAEEGAPHGFPHLRYESIGSRRRFFQGTMIL